MTSKYLGAAAALAFLPATLSAQALTPAIVAVVDTDRILRTCTVCVAAQAQIQTQVQQLQARAATLGQPLQTEEAALRTAVQGLAQGAQPDAALQTRIRTFQTSQQNAQTEIQTRQEQIQRNIAFVQQQVGQRIEPAITAVMQQRGANIAVSRGATLAINPSVEITDAVLAVVNQNNAALNVNAPPPPAQQPAAGAARPAATPPAQQPPRPRPQGR